MSIYRRKLALSVLVAMNIVGAGVLGVLSNRERRRVDSIEKALAQDSAPRQTFTTDMLAGLPEPAQRYFLHALRPGAPVPSVARLTMTGEIKPSEQLGWCPFSAEQVIAGDRGFIWRARVKTRMALLTGVDHYLQGSGCMRIALFGLLPVVNASDSDVVKSALGRFFIECAWMPSAFLPISGARVESIDENRFAVSKTIDGQEVRVTLTVDGEGRLRQLESLRWGNQTARGTHEMIPFGGSVGEEEAFGDYVLPSQVTVGWWFGTPKYKDFFRATIETASLEA